MSKYLVFKLLQLNLTHNLNFRALTDALDKSKKKYQCKIKKLEQQMLGLMYQPGVVNTKTDTLSTHTTNTTSSSLHAEIS